MGINLSKGQRLDVGLAKVGVGLGWDPNTQASGHAFDLDATAFLVGANGKLATDDWFVFYNNKTSPDGSTRAGDDDQTGGSSDGDDETIEVDLDRVDGKVDAIVFCASIHEFDVRKQNFGQIRNSFIRIYDRSTNEELAKYELAEDFSVESAVEFGRLYRRDGKWRFEALGHGLKGGLQELLSKFQ